MTKWDIQDNSAGEISIASATWILGKYKTAVSREQSNLQPRLNASKAILTFAASIKDLCKSKPCNTFPHFSRVSESVPSMPSLREHSISKFPAPQVGSNTLDEKVIGAPSWFTAAVANFCPVKKLPASFICDMDK